MFNLDRLRDRLAEECPTLDRCSLRWSVVLRETRERIHGWDGAVFPDHRKVDDKQI